MEATSAFTVSRPSVGGQSIRIRSLLAPQVPEGVAKRHLAPDLAGQHQLRLGEAEVRRDHPSVHGVDRPRLALEHVAERRVAFGSASK